MMKSTDYEQIESSLKSAFQNERGVAAVYLFGSFRAKGFNSNSDLDVGILFLAEVRPDVMDLLDLQSRLSQATHYSVDVVYLNGASPVVCMQVLRKGKKIIDRNSRITSEFFVRALNLYQDLKRVRKPTERQILNGRIYG